MGMSASQARFLGLTARKSNVEYEGQQVNQQRTALSNQSATYYNQMLALKVPTPPDVTNFYNDKYTFKDGDKDFEIISGLGSSSSCIAKETTLEYDTGCQPTNNGLPSTISLSDNLLYLNGKLLNQTKQETSSEQIRKILNKGVATDEPAFVCKVSSNDSGYTKVASDDILADTTKNKYMNKLAEFGLNDVADGNFIANLNNNVPTYYVSTDDSGKKNYTKVTDINYEECLAQMATDETAKFAQEVRNSSNKPVKVKAEQNFCDNSSGIEFFTADSTMSKITYSANTANDTTSEKYVATAKSTKSGIQSIENYGTKLADGDLICFTTVTDDDGNETYKRIETKEELDALDLNAKVYQVATKSDNSVMIPVGKDLTNTDFADISTYLKNVEETVVDAGAQYITLTQELWNEAKDAGNESLMDYYIANLDYTEDSENAAKNTLYYYVNDGVTTFVQGSYLDDFVNGVDYYQTTIAQEFYEREYDVYDNITFTNCIWDKDNATGRYIRLNAVSQETGKSYFYNLTYSREKDDDAYDQAMMEYEYKTSQYDKAVADINAKTASIQEKDKTLELRLKQLDTEQKAIQNEMEAVKKVIEKNVEDTFKTFA